MSHDATLRVILRAYWYVWAPPLLIVLLLTLPLILATIGVTEYEWSYAIF
ncbi:MAG: hypothetical protein ACON5B_16105 [Myxococcota bacterium]